MENRTINLAVVAEIEQTDKRIRQFLINQLITIMEKGVLDEVLMAHIHPLMVDERKQIVFEKISAIVKK